MEFALSRKSELQDSVLQAIDKKILFITVANVVSNMFLSLNSFFEFVASKQTRSRSRKSIKSAKKRVLGAVNGVLFSKTVSLKIG